MNILDSEEMPEVERRMLAVDPLPGYVLALQPSSPLVRSTPVQNPIYIHPELSQDHPLTKIMPNFQNPVSIREDDPNSALKLFTYSLLALLYPSSSPGANDSLLETVKCSLYSKDLDFSHTLTHSSRRIVDNLQAKAMLGKFLHMLTSASGENEERLRMGVALLDCNQMLVELFLLFFRAILGKLELEGAQEYTYALPFDEAVGNLLEFFDIPHRQLPSLFLMTEDRYFLAAAAGGLFFGDYLQGQTLRGKQQLAEKQTLTSSPQDPSSSAIPNQILKKNGVFHHDIKLFNFLLQSGGSQICLPLGQKSKQLQTPHFKQSQDFAFGRGRKDQSQIQRQEELKRQFQKLIMNSEEEEVVGMDERRKEETDSPATPVMGGDAFPASVSPFREDPSHYPKESEQQQESGKPKAFLRKSTFNQSPMAEADPIGTPRLNPENQKTCKNIVSVKDKNFTTFSPQPNVTAYNNNFTSFAHTNEAAFLDADPHGDYFKSSSGKLAEITLPLLAGQCHCFALRKTKSKMVSKVCEFVFNPKVGSSGRSPRFLHNLKYSQNINNPLLHPKIKVTPPKQLHLPSPPPPYSHLKDVESSPIPPCLKQQRIPTFLKSLKKDKEKDKYSASSKSKSKSKKSAKDPNLSPSPSPNKEGKRFQLDAQTMQKINRFVKFSAILSPKSPFQQPKAKQSKSTTRKNESSSLSRRVATELGGTIKKFDSRFVNVRPGLGSAWKSSSNFHLPQGSKKPPMDGTGKRETMRVFPSQNPIPGAFLRASNARPRDIQPKEFGIREGREVQGTTTRVVSKLTLAHSSQKYKEFTQIALTEPSPSPFPSPFPSP